MLFPTSTSFSSTSRLKEVPSVTVAVPLFNHESYVTAALDSIAAQTLSAIDLVIVNDASTDGSEARVIKWLKVNKSRFRKSKLVRNLENYGLSETRNIAFGLADTEYVFALDSDNELYPSSLAKHLAVLDRTGLSFAYSQLEVFGGEKGIGYAWVWEPEQLTEANYIDAMALVRKSAWQEAGGYPQLEGTGWEDYAFWCRLADLGKAGVFIPQILCRYRISPGSMLRTDTSKDAANLQSHLAFRSPWTRVGTLLES